MSTFLPQDANENPIPVMRLKDSGAHSISATTGASARNSMAFDAETRVISLYADVPIYVKFGASDVTASSSDHYFPSGLYYDFALGGDQSGHFTHVAVKATTSNGGVYISEKV